MFTIKKKRIVFICIGFLLIAAILAAVFWPRGSKQSDFKLFDNPPMASVGAVSFEDQMEETQIIADVTVKQLLPDVTRQYIPTEYEETELGMLPFEYTVKRVELTVNETWAGAENETLIMTISPVASFCVPDFNIGDRFVMILNPYDEGYGLVSIISSCFYVAGDEKVYPGTLQQPMTRVSGMDLTSFKQELQALYAEAHQTL
ncbi:MAG: hypothetical protein ACOX6U_01105 [Oscillospiraceae bacterium]|jgi:hypothetical protein